MMVIGTTNKVLEYARPFYTDLLSRFYSSIRDSGRLVICGYGFGDREINTQISYWVFSSRDLRITIVDIEPENLRRRMPASMFGKWDKWIEKRKLAIVRKRIEETSWADIKERIL